MVRLKNISLAAFLLFTIFATQNTLSVHALPVPSIGLHTDLGATTLSVLAPVPVRHRVRGLGDVVNGGKDVLEKGKDEAEGLANKGQETVNNTKEQGKDKVNQAKEKVEDAKEKADNATDPEKIMWGIVKKAIAGSALIIFSGVSLLAVVILLLVSIHRARSGKSVWSLVEKTCCCLPWERWRKEHSEATAPEDGTKHHRKNSSWSSEASEPHTHPQRSHRRI